MKVGVREWRRQEARAHAGSKCFGQGEGSEEDLMDFDPHRIIRVPVQAILPRNIAEREPL